MHDLVDIATEVEQDNDPSLHFVLIGRVPCDGRTQILTQTRLMADPGVLRFWKRRPL